MRCRPLFLHVVIAKPLRNFARHAFGSAPCGSVALFPPEIAWRL